MQGKRGTTRLVDRSPRWEPEPVRWVESLLIGKTMAWSDANEDRSGKPSRVGGVADFFGI